MTRRQVLALGTAAALCALLPGLDRAMVARAFEGSHYSVTSFGDP